MFVGRRSTCLAGGRISEAARSCGKLRLFNMVSVPSLPQRPRHFADLAARPHLRMNSDRHRRLHCEGAADRDRGKWREDGGCWAGAPAGSSARQSGESFPEQMCQFEGTLIHYEE